MPRQFGGAFLTIEGIEGVGKSTAVKFVQNYLQEKQINPIVTREPGGTFIAEEIRKALLTPNPDEIMQPETELLLMFASRIQHIQQVILPALMSGQWVLCDRFVDASYAYQGGGRGIDLSYIAMLDKWLVKNLRPDITILLDAPPEVGLFRAKHRGPHDRIEQEKMDFFERVRATYLELSRQDKQRFRVIDATQSLSLVQAELQRVLHELL